MRERVDVVIVGGGAAGLSAALLLGRSRRRVVVCDAGRPRNARAPHSHGYLTRDGMPPLELLALARGELRAYDVTVRDTEVTRVTCTATGAETVLADGTSLNSRKLLLATGVEDVRPDVRGCEALYGISVHHCPYCDGWENRDRPLAVYGPPDQATGLAVSLLTWSRDLVICTDGRRLTTSSRARLAGTGIAVRTEALTALEGTDGRLRRIIFASGPPLERHALFFNTGQVQRSRLAETLGCQFTSRGHVRCDRKGKTGVANLFVAGDANGDVQFVIVAAAEGAKAAVAINKELQEEDARTTARR
jgi:thioredoxin reductase